MCQQRTVRLGVGSPDCAFCGFPIDAVTLAGDIAARGVEVCPECGEKTLALDLQTDEGGYLICTSCATRVEWHSSCPRCGKLGGITGSFLWGLCGQAPGREVTIFMQLRARTTQTFCPSRACPQFAQNLAGGALA